MRSGGTTFSEALIIKQTSKKIFSRHIEARVKGFLDYFTENNQQIRPVIIEIDLQQKSEPEKSLQKAVFENPEIKTVFIPNSRVFLFADFIEKNNLPGYSLTGYDIIEENIAHLEKGNISFLICQKPDIQAYNAIMTLFDHLLTGEEKGQTNFSPIDIINKENIKYYKSN
jgi:LacI family transcriptional regulator